MSGDKPKRVRLFVALSEWRPFGYHTPGFMYPISLRVFPKHVADWLREKGVTPRTKLRYGMSLNNPEWVVEFDEP